tara:strand:- start:555 stop:1169 length:615 start_codon:yes stop_codon:yes gene_type:complete
MISTKFLGFGTLLFVIGVAAVAAFMFKITPDPNIYTGGAGMAALGLVCMALGLISLAGKAFIPQSGIQDGDSAAFSIGLIRCMLAISIADDYLDDNEIAQIAKIYRHLTGAEIGEETIRDTAAEMQQYGINIENELKNVAPSLDNNLKEKLVIASLFILTADGDMDEDEWIMLDDIRLGIGMSLKQIDKIQRNFMKKQNVKKTA